MDAVNKYMYRMLVALTLAVLAFGTVFYHLTEKWSLLDAYYFCVVTLTTVGYGDITPHTNSGKLFTTFYIIVGIGIIGAFVNAFIKRNSLKAHKRAETKAQNKHKQ